MKLCFIDFETYWSVTHSLTKMNPIAYVMHPDTEIISVSLRVDDGRKRGPNEVLFGEEAIKERLDRIDWSDTMAIGHNMSGFDSMILAWRFGIRPKMWGCTLAMARPFYQSTVGGSLKNVAERLGLGVKGDLEGTNTKGKRLKDFTPEERFAMRAYNAQDTELCAGIFYALAPKLPAYEMKLIDMTVRMLTEPQFEVDEVLLERTLVEERARKRESLLNLATVLRVNGEHDIPLLDDDELAEYMKTQLASALKFSHMLETLGREVPMKVSPTNPDKLVPALAKTDDAFIAMQEDENPLVAAAAQARLGVKSTILETRIASFLEVSRACGGKMPVFLNYHAATTGRWGGGGGLNQQNMPRVPRDKQGNIIEKPTNALRMSLRAPKGKVVVVADLSGIELRVNHFLWQARSSTELYRADPEKADLYKDFASKLYFKSPDDVTKDERQIGKVCLAEGTLVLTDRGEVPIEEVSSSDRVWDGVEWVSTGGAIYSGERDVISYDGITATPDHEVWVEDGRKVSIGFAAAQSLRLARTGAAGVPLGFGGAGIEGDHTEERVPICAGEVHRVSGKEGSQLRQPPPGENAGVSVLPAEVRGAEMAVEADGVSTATLYQPERPRVQELWSEGGGVSLSVRSSGSSLGGGELGVAQGIGSGSNRHERQLRAGEFEVRERQGSDRDPAEVALAPVSRVQSELPGGTLRGQHAAESAESGALGRGDCGQVARPIVQAKRRVWDLLNCGPRHRFTANGRLVSNCHLGLGFGAGAKTFVRVAKLMGGVDLDEQDAYNIVQRWRNEYHEIKTGWQQCSRALASIYNGEEGVPIDPGGLCVTHKEGIKTPVGMIRYPALEHDPEDRSFWYGEGRNRQRITGPKCDENIVQHLARCIIAEQMLKINRRYRVALTVHDEVVCVVPESEGQECLDFMLHTMKQSPSWWPDILLSAEGDIADSYGAAK